MEESNIREIKKNIDVLLGSVESHQCDPQEDCEECHGSGDCHHCQGDGKVDCDDCHGSGDCHHCHGHGRDRCNDCHGQGSNRCDKCGGSGTCRKCGGSGQVRCKKCGGQGTVKEMKSWEHEYHWNTCTNCNGKGYVKCPDCSGFFGSSGSGNCKKCDGTGQLKCKKCDGSGEIVCKHCSGSGKCTNCKGTGELTCKHCNGSGKCTNCKGTGKVTCRRCKGSGWYQTFIKNETTLYAKDWTFVSKNPLNEAIDKSTGPVIYNGIYKKWKSADLVEFDRTEDVYKAIKEYLGEFADKADEYISAYNANTEVKKPAQMNDKPYCRQLKASAIPVTKIEYTTNGVDYVLYLSGDNHIVSYESVPTEISAYRHTLFERIKLAFSEKKRMKQYAMLAAYIFQCDGKTKEESRLLNLILQKLELSDSAESKFKEKLEGFNSSMPYEDFRKQIKGLFSTKKTLSFAWQCMAVDKTVSETEKELFDKLCGEFNLESNEKEVYMNYAKRFARIKDDDIIEEYCDVSNKSKKLRKTIYSGIIALLLILLVSGAAIYFTVINPPIKSPSPKKEIVKSNSADDPTESEIEKAMSDMSIDGEVNDVEIDVEENADDKALADELDDLIDSMDFLNVTALIGGARDISVLSSDLLTSFGYKSFGKESGTNYWAKNCTYSKKAQKATDVSKKSSVLSFPSDGSYVKLTVFHKPVLKQYINDITAIGYKKTDEYGSSSGNTFEVYTSSIYPQITISDETGDNSDMPYNITVEK